MAYRSPLASLAAFAAVALGGGSAVGADGPAPTGDTSTIVVAPGAARPDYVGPLQDAYRRIDPSEDGWDTEAFSESASAILKRLAKAIGAQPAPLPDDVAAAIAPGFTGTRLSPATNPAPQDGALISVVHEADDPDPASVKGRSGLADELARLRQTLGGNPTEPAQVELKVVTVTPSGTSGSSFETSVLLHAAGPTASSRSQLNAHWTCHWTVPDGSDEPMLGSVRASGFESVHATSSADGPLFADVGATVFGGSDTYRDQLAVPTDHWRLALPRVLGLDPVANHGLALGDVTGDGLDDLYLCQQGGLPNRLFVQLPDGTLEDRSASSGADWLDYSAAALLVDLDNDGDRDLVVALEFRLLFMDNLGGGRFELAYGQALPAQTFSLASADYDLDGDLDVYSCGYNPMASAAETGAMGEPLPYHDANNGGPNTLFRNDGGWRFTDVTTAVGLGANNSRFSFAASWEDFDLDGDPDLYVANDYGRNNLYRNDGARFTDVAPELGVEDISAGMSVSWGDVDRNGHPDLYVSNMFSSAGNRITYQRQFKEGTDADVRASYQRHARGNSLFTADGHGGFVDTSVVAGVTMGRWAWGSGFADLDNDGDLDIAIANGFISAPDTGDL